MTDDPRVPAVFPEAWASSWGEDEYGLWMASTYKRVRQVFRWIAPGRFRMGSPAEEPERSSDETRHEVLLTEGFWLADTACTQALWEAVMGQNPSRFQGAARPVEMVSWDDVQLFIQRLNSERDDLGLRLPTEAEWEHACRAGTETPFWFGANITTDQVNYDGNYPYADGKKGLYREETVEVKALPCNSWGLYQMHGNVWEWVEDDWHDNYQGAPTDGSAWMDTPRGAVRVLRGGSWYIDAWYCRSAYRNGSGPDDRVGFFGFRLARGQTGRQARK